MSAAKRYGLISGVQTACEAYELVRNGRLGAIKLGKKIIVPKLSLIDFCRNEVKGMESWCFDLL